MPKATAQFLTLKEWKCDVPHVDPVIEAKTTRVLSIFSALVDTLLVDAESGGASESNEINFEGPAASEEMSDDEKVISIQKTDEFGENQNEASSHFSTDSMTPPEELPEGMIYDPFEIPSEEANAQESTSQQNTDLKFTEETKSATSLSNLTQEFIQRIQKGSVGQILALTTILKFMNFLTKIN